MAFTVFFVKKHHGKDLIFRNVRQEILLCSKHFPHLSFDAISFYSRSDQSLRNAKTNFKSGFALRIIQKVNYTERKTIYEFSVTKKSLYGLSAF
jgi:hypothetical protein